MQSKPAFVLWSSWIEITYVYGSNIIVVREVMSGHFTIYLHCGILLGEVNDDDVRSAEIHTKKCLS